jgi:MFS transporter, DHA1 family, multidrug resistance protein
MSRRLTPPLWLLVLVTFSGTLAMHMFVPALPAAAHDLRTTSAAAQMTITMYVLGLAIGQLVYGPLSDRYGRRPTLIAGLMLYTAAGMVCLLAPNVHVLIAARFAQALGGCAGLLLARAIVRDTADAHSTLRRLAMLSLITMVGPGLAPLLGGVIAAMFGWREVLVCFVALGLIGLATSWQLLPETLSPRDPQAPPSRLSADYLALLRSPEFVGCVIGGGCATTGFYAFIAAAPFLFVEQLHQPVEAVGIYLCVLILGISTGNFIASRLVGRVSVDTLMVSANAISLICALFLLADVLLFGLDTTRIVAGMFLYCAGAGMCSPAVSTKAMSLNPQVSGSAAGLFGFAQMAIGALCTLLAALGNDHGFSAIVVMVGAGVLGQAAFWVSITRRPRALPIEKPVLRRS